MIFALLLFLTGITLSAVAIYYSVIGLTSIFAAAFWPVVVMGTTLEVAKLVAASWLKAYWESIPRFMKIYMSIAVVVLMLITSMGIFGFLSKAHLDQNIVSGDVTDKISLFDEKIKTERDNIETARKALAQMDAQVDARLSRSDDEKGAERAVQIRRQQQTERGRLQKDIADSQARIAKLNEERAPIAKELRKVEAEVGPIKYIAKLIYGDNPDANILEKAVTWVIMVIVFVFDPLAVLLLLGSQMTYQWHRGIRPVPNRETLSVPDEKEPPVEQNETPAANDSYKFWPFPLKNPDPDQTVLNNENPEITQPVDQPNETKLRLSNIVKAVKGFSFNPPKEETKEEEKSALEDWNKMIEEAERAAKEEQEKEDDEMMEGADRLEKEAMKAWKADHPHDSLKRQRRMFDHGSITELPWLREPYYVNDSLTAETVAESYNAVVDQEQRIKPDLTEVIEPGESLKLSDLKKKDMTYLEKMGPEQIQKPLK